MPVGIALILVLWIAAALVMDPNEYVRRVLLWRNSDVGDYLHHFPQELRDLLADSRERLTRLFEEATAPVGECSRPEANQDVLQRLRAGMRALGEVQ